MSQRESLHYVAKRIYEKNTRRISNCFTLEGLKNIGIIYIPEDAPVWVIEIAAQLKQTIGKQYPESHTEIVMISPLFSRFSYADDYLEEVYKKISAGSAVDTEGEKLLLCGTNVAAAMMRLHDNARYKYPSERLPTLFLDVDAYRRCKPQALADAAEKLGLAAQVVEIFAPYRCKKYNYADYFVVYASGSESWQDLIHAWHAVKQEYARQPQIIYIDDLRRWTSVEYGENILAKFSKLLRRMSIKNAKITVIPSAEIQLVLNMIDNKPSIMFIPQLKTYLCELMVAEQLTFDICEKEFEEHWNLAGPIARQFFCQELKEFQKIDDESRLKFCRLVVLRRFKNWNLKFYWWNYKIRLSNLCRQIFLSEFLTYR